MYPAYAEAQPDGGVFAVQGPQGLRLHDRYRNQLDVDTLSAVTVLEMVHMTGLDKLIAADFQAAGFTWSPELTPITKQQRIINGHPVFHADQPEACVTGFGVFDAEQDACESVVAYTFDELPLHPTKQRIIGTSDQDAPVPTYNAVKLAEPTYPQLPERFSFFYEPKQE